MGYPHYVRIQGEKIPIKTDYITALKCFDVINNDNIGDYERALAVVFLLYGYIPKDELIGEYLTKAKVFLQCGDKSPEHESKAADMDFNYDRKFINASFMSDYHIDLEANPNMHFWQFCELIQGLTEKSILSRVRYIRNCDVKDFSKKDRATIQKAKEELALPIKRTKEQQEAIDLFEARLRGEV